VQAVLAVDRAALGQAYLGLWAAALMLLLYMVQDKIQVALVAVVTHGPLALLGLIIQVDRVLLLFVILMHIVQQQKLQEAQVSQWPAGIGHMYGLHQGQFLLLAWPADRYLLQLPVPVPQQVRW
jgi:hypothetical protein